MDDRDSRNGTSLAEEAHCGGPLWMTPLLRTLEGMLRKAPNTGIFLHREFVGPRETWNLEGVL